VMGGHASGSMEPDYGETLDLATQHDLTACSTVARYEHGEIVPEATTAAPVVSVAESLNIDEHYLLKSVRDVAETAMTGISVFDRDGIEVGTQPQPAAALKALELLMRAQGLLVERKEVTHAGGLEIRIVGVNTDELT